MAQTGCRNIQNNKKQRNLKTGINIRNRVKIDWFSVFICSYFSILNLWVLYSQYGTMEYFWAFITDLVIAVSSSLCMSASFTEAGRSSFLFSFLVLPIVQIGGLAGPSRGILSNFFFKCWNAAVVAGSISTFGCAGGSLPSSRGSPRNHFLVCLSSSFLYSFSAFLHTIFYFTNEYQGPK